MKTLLFLACLALTRIYAQDAEGPGRVISEQKEQYDEGDSKKDYRCYGPKLSAESDGSTTDFPMKESRSTFTYVMAQDAIAPIGGYLRYMEAIIQGEHNIGKTLTFHFMEDVTTGDPAHVHFYIYSSKTVEINGTGVQRWSFMEGIDNYKDLPPIADKTFVAVEWRGDGPFPIPYRSLDSGYHSGEDMITNELLGSSYVTFDTPMVNKTFAYTTCIQLRDIPTTTPPPTTTTHRPDSLKFPGEFTGMGCYGPNPVTIGNTNKYEGGPLSYIALDGSTELPFGRLMSIEFFIVNPVPFWITLYRQKSLQAAQFEVINVWKHEPTRTGYDKIIMDDEVPILVLEDSRWGITYEGDDTVPIPYDVIEAFPSYEKSEVVGTQVGEVVKWKRNERSNKVFRLRTCVALGGTTGTGGKGSNQAENIVWSEDNNHLCPVCPQGEKGETGPPGPPGPAARKPPGPPRPAARKRRETEVVEHVGFFRSSQVVLAGFTWNVIITVLLASLAIYVVIQIHRLKAIFEAQSRYYSPDELQVKS